MKYKILFILALNSLSFFSYAQDLGPGYQWDLFRNTPNWELAQALSKEDVGKIDEILKNEKVRIDLQEPKFGQSLLFLAIGNDKERSAEALLKAGANVGIRAFNGDQAIHEAVKYIDLRKHSYNILKLLIEHGANVNSRSSEGNFLVPLESAAKDFSCAKLLLEHGADPYVKEDNSYVVWSHILTTDYSDKIYVARYLIVDKKMLVPNPVFDSKAIHNPLTIFDLLKKTNFSKDPKKQQAKQDIIKYLHEIDFPKNGVHKDA